MSMQVGRDIQYIQTGNRSHRLRITMKTENKIAWPQGKRRARALDREKMQVRQAVPDLIAREAAEFASRQDANRPAALEDIRRRVTQTRSATFERAFFECLAEWLEGRGHDAAAAVVREFIDAHIVA
jgi:hypothetical protein